MEKIILLFILILLLVYLCNKNKDDLVKTKISNDDHFDYLLKLYNKFNIKFEFNLNTLNSVDQIYCISMPQRKKYITTKMDELNVNYTLLNAITPDDLTKNDISILSNISDPKSKIHNKFTRLALQLSFTMCFLDAIKKGYSTIIVFEDDIIVNVDYQRLNSTISEFKKTDYSLFYMGYCFTRCGNVQNNTDELFLEIKNKNILCCHAVCYKVKYLPGLINYLYKMDENFDEAIVSYNQKNNIKVCITAKTFFDQNRKELGTLNEDSFTGDNLDNCNEYFMKNK
jgi:hypothetical protein